MLKNKFIVGLFLVPFVLVNISANEAKIKNVNNHLFAIKSALGNDIKEHHAKQDLSESNSVRDNSTFTKLRALTDDDARVLFLERINYMIHKKSINKEELGYLMDDDVLELITDDIIPSLQTKYFKIYDKLEIFSGYFTEEFSKFYKNHLKPVVNEEKELEVVVYSDKLFIRNHVFYDIKLPEIGELKRGDIVTCSQLINLGGKEWCKLKSKSYEYIDKSYTKGLVR